MTTELKEQDYVLLSAYIDGELAPTECRKLEDRIANCPVLTRQFNIMAGQSIVLRNQSDRLLNDRVYPELSKSIADILDQKPVAKRNPAHEQTESPLKARAANNNTAIWTGIGAAAAVLLAFVGGNWFNENLTNDQVVLAPKTDTHLASFSQIGNPVLDHEISLTLEKTLSGDIRHVALAQNQTRDSASDIQIEPLRTFRQGGRFCREYRVTFPVDAATATQDGFYGRACRTGEGQWETVYRLIPGVELPDLEEAPPSKQKL
ncbi:hypothetical protein [Thalassospira sp. CH_XMU1448-2]|uniref:hypothetical protein n=1 Tax=Thalassospira sp. CH_XMU1448-2 TaxID=3107773 RepID=UPI003009F9E3